MPTALKKTARSDAGSTSETPPTARRAFVVIGMHRSGTSAITRSLSLSGAALPEQVMLPGPDNPTGFWESQRVTDLNDEILQTLGSDWEDVFSFGLSYGLTEIRKNFSARAKELLKQEYRDQGLIVLKDPRISVLTVFWDEVLRKSQYQPHYLIMVRNPLEVAESLRARDAFPTAKSFLLWANYMVAAERDTRGRGRSFLSYDQLMKDWRTVRRRLEKDAAFEFPNDLPATECDVKSFLDHDLRHHRKHLQDLTERRDVPEDVKALYRVFLDASEGAEVDSAAVDHVESRLIEARSLAGAALADLRGRARRFAAQVAELHDAHAGARGQADTLAEQLQTERTQREEGSKASRKEASEQARQIKKLESQIEKAKAQRERANEKLHAERAKVRDRDLQMKALEKEAEGSRARAVSAEDNLAEFVTALDAVETEFEEALRIVAWNADARISELEAEIGRLTSEAHADRLRAENLQAELDAERRQTSALRSTANAAETKLRQLEQALDDIEEEIEQTVRDVEIQAEQAQMRCRELEGKYEEAVARRKVVVSELASTKASLAKIRGSASWRLTAPLRKMLS